MQNYQIFVYRYSIKFRNMLHLIQCQISQTQIAQVKHSLILLNLTNHM